MSHFHCDNIKIAVVQCAILSRQSASFLPHPVLSSQMFVPTYSSIYIMACKQYLFRTKNYTYKLSIMNSHNLSYFLQLQKDIEICLQKHNSTIPKIISYISNAVLEKNYFKDYFQNGRASVIFDYLEINYQQR